ncbi:hypothetical protein ABB37_03460 [Leptomonas pyrrhocoris]|uniref:Uncharacterized protein n=1 Tax=Leptomonas pyrrhocoris TaxID=157538 RepID=A0A0N0VFZ9_LEPPY|nr:hypothetical protein ABB37_03460 [Leptomonas pyrrhocoris]KPA82381.1 hypothetical protein ABB37_03460 [Leptomonas pyrrhocoris]|eukprot:XP_015660820.1 hypothetical protein ABB37_03460 [Leptomonas pyrrhocoris]
MNLEIRAQFSLTRFTAGDALHFIMTNGGKRRDEKEASADPSLPGLAKVVELQERRHDYEKVHQFGFYDPLCAGHRVETESHEQVCVHSQTACALAKNAVNAALRHRIEIRVTRYGEALFQLANTSENEEVEEGSTAIGSDSAAGSPNLTSDCLGDGIGAKDGDAAETDEDDDDLETYLLRLPGFGTETATAWLQRRYLRCCELMNVRPSVVVSHRLSQCVHPCRGGTVGSFFAAQKATSPLSPLPERLLLSNTKAARCWMTFPEMLVLLRVECAIPYELNLDLHGCGDIGKQVRHFVAALGVLEGCRYTVVALNLSNTGLTDREARVLCFFCHAHLRRLKVLDISNNRGVTEKMALRLKKMAASLPLLSRLSVHGTSLSAGTVRVIDRLLSRKIL